MEPIKLRGKTITKKDISCWNNVLEQVENLDGLVKAGKELVDQGFRYNRELSWDISTESACCIFNNSHSAGPYQIILELPIRHHQLYSEKFHRHIARCMNVFDYNFVQYS